MQTGNIVRRLLLPALVVLAPWATSCSDSSPAEGAGVSKQVALTAKEVSVVDVARRNFDHSLSATGSLIPVDAASIRALQPGPLVEVAVDIGDRVRKGHVLFRVRPVEAENAVRSARAQRATAEANLRDLQAWRRPEEVDVLEAQVERARVEARRLENEMERADVLLERGAISKSQWEQAQTASQSAEAELRVAEEQLHIAKAGPTAEQLEVARSRVQEADARLQETLQRLDDTVVEAPYSGIITARFHEVGDFVQRGQEVVEVSDLSHLEAEMKVPERYSRVIRKGLTVEVRIASINKSRDGKVVAVNEAIDRNTRTFLVKVAVDNSDYLIKAGAFCTGSFVLPPIENALAIPTTALRTREGQTYVWVSRDGTAHRADVVSGERSDSWIEIVEGVSGSEQIITEGAGALSEGDAIRIQSGETPASGS